MRGEPLKYQLINIENKLNKKVKLKVKGMSQTRVAANDWHQEEEERGTTHHAPNVQMHEKHTEQPSKRGDKKPAKHENKTHGKT